MYTLIIAGKKNLSRVRKFFRKIWAESEGKGKGSTFFIELPVG